MNCVSIGDSIALGFGQAAHCETHAKIGAGTRYIATHYSAKGGSCFISAGSNDPDSPTLADDLRDVRKKVSCERVTWIAPQNPRAGRLVRQIASEYGDGLVTFVAGPDRVHPRDYKEILNKYNME